MNECMDEMGVTAAKYLREFLVVYLYGAHELLRMTPASSHCRVIVRLPTNNEPGLVPGFLFYGICL